MDLWRLVGLPIIVAGFAAGFFVRIPVSVVVLVAGLATGWAAELRGGPDALETLGKAFTDYRTISLFVLALPAIGLSERYGLQERARDTVAGLRAVTAGRVELAYHAFRMAVVALGIRLSSGHVTFSRPIVVPMALGAAGVADEASDEAERVKAASGASENYANFFSQNLFPASAGVALIVKTLEGYGLTVPAARVSLWTIPAALIAFAIASAQYRLLDRWLRRRASHTGADGSGDVDGGGRSDRGAHRGADGGERA